MSFLEVKNLKSGYGAKQVIDGISFSVDKGEFIGIIGPNGAGKTTLLKTLTHIIRPTDGSVVFEGKDIHSQNSCSVAKSFAMVSQDLISIFSFTAKEIVLMGRTPYIGMLGHEKKEDLKIVDEAIMLTDLEGLQDRPIDELSAGERQRVLVARALAQQPQVFLLDEPTAHLDIGYQVEILDLVKSLQKKKAITTVCVLHDLNLASQYSDKILLLNKGRIIDYGPPKDILNQEIIEKVFNAAIFIDDKTDATRPFIKPLTRFLNLV
jgi:iron complex transport system ATP-binding protein